MWFFHVLESAVCCFFAVSQIEIVSLQGVHPRGAFEKTVTKESQGGDDAKRKCWRLESMEFDSQVGGPYRQGT